MYAVPLIFFHPVFAHRRTRVKWTLLMGELEWTLLMGELELYKWTLLRGALELFKWMLLMGGHSSEEC